jgi:hypothetical protein
VLPLLLAGCLQVPDDWLDQALWTPLDYTLDRPRVLAVRLSPPVAVHGLPTTVDALALGPSEPRRIDAAICGLRMDTRVTVATVDCFAVDDLVDDVATDLPRLWDPPDLSGIVQETTATALDDDDSGTWWESLDNRLYPPGASLVPLLITARFPSSPAFGSLLLPVVHAPYAAGDAVPPSADTRGRSLTALGDAVPGGEVELTFAFAGRPHSEGYHWYVDAGVLRRTGRTAVEVERSDGWTETTNLLEIPREWRGPLRVVVVVATAEGAASATLAGDVTWEILTLDVGS